MTFGVSRRAPYTRDEKMGSLREVTVMVAKVRNKVAGSIGDPKLEYNLSNGRYEDLK